MLKIHLEFGRLSKRHAPWKGTVVDQFLKSSIRRCFVCIFVLFARTLLAVDSPAQEPPLGASEKQLEFVVSDFLYDEDLYPTERWSDPDVDHVYGVHALREIASIRSYENGIFSQNNRRIYISSTHDEDFFILVEAALEGEVIVVSSPISKWLILSAFSSPNFGDMLSLTSLARAMAWDTEDCSDSAAWVRRLVGVLLTPLAMVGDFFCLPVRALRASYQAFGTQYHKLQFNSSVALANQAEIMVTEAEYAEFSRLAHENSSFRDEHRFLH